MLIEPKNSYFLDLLFVIQIFNVFICVRLFLLLTESFSVLLSHLIFRVPDLLNVPLAKERKSHHTQVIYITPAECTIYFINSYNSHMHHSHTNTQVWKLIPFGGPQKKIFRSINTVLGGSKLNYISTFGSILYNLIVFGLCTFYKTVTFLSSSTVLVYIKLDFFWM